MPSPIILFTYNRPFETEKTISALRNNYLASESILYIFSDGPKNQSAIDGVEKTRSIIRQTYGFKDVIVKESPHNKGLANSIVDGVTSVIEKHGRAIILEDDLVTTPNFLDFMNQSLDFFESNNKVFSISGFTLPLKNMPNHVDFYTGYRASSWAWGTWQRVWADIDWNISNFEEFYKNRKSRRDFNRGGSDMTKMLKDQIDGRIDSWAIRFCFHQFQRKMVTVFPTVSKAESIGFGSDATHTFNESRFKTLLDNKNKRSFQFDNNVDVAPQLAKDFRKFFSIRIRIADRLRRYAKNLRLIR